MKEYLPVTALLDEYAGKYYNQAFCSFSQKGEIIYSHAVDCKEASLFDLASITKVLTGTIFLRLAGMHLVSLDDNVCGLFGPYIAGGKSRERLRPVTFRMLLTHSSGIAAWYPFYTCAGGFWDVLEIFLQRSPREQDVVYSDINFMLLGEAVRLLTGKTLAENLEDLNTVLGTGFVYNPIDKNNCIATEYGNEGERKMCGTMGLNYGGWRNPSMQSQGEVNDGNACYFWHGESGHAGAFGSASDVVKLGELYLRGGRAADGGQFIPRRLVEESFCNHGGGRGLIWDISEVFPHGAGHTGFTGTAVWICREKGIASALMASRLPLPGPPNLQCFRKECHNTIYNLL